MNRPQTTFHVTSEMQTSNHAVEAPKFSSDILAETLSAEDKGLSLVKKKKSSIRSVNNVYIEGGRKIREK